MTELGLVGPGVLGRTLALSLPTDSYKLGPVLAQSEVSSRRAVREMKRGYAVQDWAELSAVRTILVTVPQGGIEDTLRAAEEGLESLRGRRFLVAGAGNAPVLKQAARLEAQGAQVGGLIPIALYRRPSIVAPNTSFAVWGRPATLRSARRLVNALGGKHSVINSECASQALLAVALVSGVLTTSLELAIRRLVRAGFPRHRALEALAPLTDGCIQEHRHSRHRAPANRFPASCSDLLAMSSEGDALDSRHCQASLRLACQKIE